MRDKNGRFIKGQHASPKTEFKNGQHWRDRKPYWDKEWLYREYVTNSRSAEDIAKQFNITEAAILYHLRKLEIPRRDMTDIRAKKHWGSSGEMNGMFGRTGEDSSNWKGGVTPERQALYCSQEWADAVKTVWKRDNATCQRCGKHRENIAIMHIHHIVSFADSVELRTEPDNLILLCKKCHNWIHSKKNIDKIYTKEVAGNDIKCE